MSYDAVIDVLLNCIKAFTIINDCLDEDYSNVLTWLNEQLAIVWEDRGAFPGLGVMLSAFGIQLGIPMAREIKATFEEKHNDFWEYVDAVIANPEPYLSEGICKSITPIVQKTWKTLKTERKQLFQLLCRFALNIDQAIVLFNENQREKKHIFCSDREILENPYILYEQTRLKLDDLYLSVQKVDRAVFPVPSIAEKYPLQAPSCLVSDNDERRIRSVVISVLEYAAVQGHSFLPCTILTNQVQNMTLEPACPATPDMITAIESFMSTEVLKREMKDGSEYYKLARLNAFDTEIERRVGLRTAIQQFICNGGEGLTMDVFGSALSDYWQARMSEAQYIDTFIPYNMAGDRAYEELVKTGEFLDENAKNGLISDVRKRIRYETFLEFGLSSQIGRTLEKSGAAMITPDIGQIEDVAKAVLLRIDTNPALKSIQSRKSMV